MNKLTIAPRWTWEDPGPDIAQECQKSHMALGEICVTLGKWEKKSLGGEQS